MKLLSPAAIPLAFIVAVLGQVTPDAGPIVSSVSNLSAVGLLGWYLWYTQTKTIPAITADHREAVALTTAAASQALRENAESHRVALALVTDAAAGLLKDSNANANVTKKLLADTFRDEMQAERARFDALLERLHGQQLPPPSLEGK